MQAADKVKRQLADELGVPLVPPLPQQRQQQQQGTEANRHSGMQEAAISDSSGDQAAEGAALSPQQAGAAADGDEGPAAAGSQVDLEMHPFNVRRSALALQRYGHQMPDAKRRCGPERPLLAPLRLHSTKPATCCPAAAIDQGLLRQLMQAVGVADPNVPRHGLRRGIPGLPDRAGAVWRHAGWCVCW